MKTLKGKPIEGDLLTLYKYYFSPGGGYKEALQLADANKQLNALEVLIENQISDMHELWYRVTNTATLNKINYHPATNRTKIPDAYLP